MNKFMFALGIIVLIVALFSMSKLVGKSNLGLGSWTVYGNNHCGWTRKQLEMMDSKKIPYKYVDCEVENCPGIDGFPTLKNDDGTVKVGYTPM